MAGGINFSNQQINFDERAILEDLRKDIFLNLKVMDIGTVTSVNFSRNTLEATINYRKTILVKNDIPTGQQGVARPNYIPKEMDYPKLTDVPMFYLGSPTAGVTTPVKAGDQCILIYNDRSLDSWFQDKNQKTLSSNRLHSMSDAVAIVGVNSLKDAIQWLSDGVQVFNGTTKIVLKQKIKVENSAQNLNTLLQNLVTKLNELSTQISTLTVIGVTPGPPTSSSGIPSNAAQFITIASDLTQIGTQIGELLE